MDKENEVIEIIPWSSELNSLMDFIKNELSKELPTLTVDTNYFLLGALAHKDNDLYLRLDRSMTSMALQNMYNAWYQEVSSRAISSVKPNRVPSYDNKMQEVLANAEKEAKDMGSSEITSEHVFLSILSDTDGGNKIRKVFNKVGITYGTMKGKVKEGRPSDDVRIASIQNPDGSTTEIRMIEASSPEEAGKILRKKMFQQMSEDAMMGIPGQKKRKGKNQFISEYCTNLNDLAKEGKLDSLVGREKEVSEIIRILGRKKKNNAILLGGEGVGKTAIGESLALKIVNGDVPEFLIDKKIVSLDMTALMAGTTLRGMFEERVKGILDDIKKDDSFILFMDNIGAILADKGKNDYEISAMLSRALESGEIQVIGTSDFASYRKTFDKDPSLARRFHKIVVEAPSVKESIDILNGLKGTYEKYHHVKYTDEAINACVVLSDRYMTDRNLPDSAIDIMDEIGAQKNLVQEPSELREIRKEISSIDLEIDNKDKKPNYVDEEKERLNDRKSELIEQYNTMKRELDKKRKENPIEVSKEDIMSLISIKTGIPVSNLTSDDKKKLAGINNRLKEGVVGQDEAIDTICKALKRNRIGLRKNGCMYSAILIGKSGVGKTLIAKKLAKELFGDEKAMVRFDMSEYSDKVSVNKLIGSNPGYVGYEEGGQLTEAIKNKKHCVLLLDEIEKADPEVYNIFLQVLDEGFLTDNSGMKVDFGNVIVIFTSNVGTKAASDFGKGVGFTENEDLNTKRILTKQLKNRFPPEFINRIDNVIYFNSLTDENLKDIIKIELGKLGDNMESIGHKIEYDDDVVEYILEIVKKDKEFGARPIMRAIQDEIEDKITDSILENDYEDSHLFKISCPKEESAIVVA